MQIPRLIDLARIEDSEVRLSKSELLGVSLSIVAGADSSTPTTGWIVAYLIRHPEWQEKLYAELKSRWSDHIQYSWADADENEIPLFDAFIREILRFFPPLRSGIPRAAYQDVAHESALIPAGTTTLLNIWACNRGMGRSVAYRSISSSSDVGVDPAVFDRPNDFIPERWLDEGNKANPRHVSYSFGLGARNCPASFLTYRLLYLVLVRLVWAFTIHPSPTSPPPSDDPILGSTNFSALATPPDPYEAVFKPRDEVVLEEVLRESDAK